MAPSALPPEPGWVRDGDPRFPGHRQHLSGGRVHQHGAGDIDRGDRLVAPGVTTDERGSASISPDVALDGGHPGTSQLAVLASPTSIPTLGPAGLAEHGIDDAIDRMAAHVRDGTSGQSLRVGVGDTDRPDLSDRLAAALARSDGIVELTR